MTLEYIKQFGAKIDPGAVGIPTVNANSVLSNSLDLVYFFAGVTCVIVIVVAGIMYATSGGDSGKVQQAKNAILYAVIGILVVMMAFVITGFVLGRF